MNIEKRLIPEELYKTKSPYTMKPKFITIHNTANKASAENEYAYAFLNAGKNKTTGWHIVVDDVKVIQAIPFNRNAWHAGDGGIGKGNRESIGIEICYSTDYTSNKYELSEKNSIEVVVQLMKEFSIPIENIKQHYEWSGKDCPHRMRKEKRWHSYLMLINKRYKELYNKEEGETIMKDKFVEGYQIVKWLGKSIHVYKQPKGSKIGLISGDVYNQRKSLNQFRLSGKKILSLINASYFENNSNSLVDGMVYGREQSFTRDDRPDQSQWLDLVIKNDLSIVFRNLASWEYLKNEVILGLSPAVGILLDGKEITEISSQVGYGKYSKAYPQTLLMQNYDNEFIFAVTRENLTGKQCRDFAISYGMKNAFMLDSGGSSQMVADNKFVAKTERTLPNALCFYKDEEIISNTPNENSEIKTIGNIVVNSIGLNIRKEPLGQKVGFLKVGEKARLIDFVDGIQKDGYQWVKILYNNSICYVQYDSKCYWIDLD